MSYYNEAFELGQKYSRFKEVSAELKKLEPNTKAQESLVSELRELLSTSAQLMTTIQKKAKAADLASINYGMQAFADYIKENYKISRKEENARS